MLEVVVDRSDDRGDDEELKDGPDGGGQNADHREDDPQRQPEQKQYPDGLYEGHAPPSFVLIVGGDLMELALSSLYQ